MRMVGIYVDTDVELIRKFDDVLNCQSFYAIQQNGNFINTGLCFGAEKENPVIKEMIEYYNNIGFNDENKKNFACPYINTEILSRYGYVKENRNQYIAQIGAYIYSSEYFDPICPDTTLNLITNKTISIHHYTATWMGNKIKIKRKVTNFIGQKRVNIIKNIVKRGKK